MKREAPGVARLAWLWLVGSLALVVAPHLFRLPVWLGLLCVAAIAWRLLRDLKGWALPGPWVRFALTVGGIWAVLGAYGTVIGREGGAALLVVMLSLKLVEMRTFRDASVVILLAYFLVATVFFFDQSIFIGAYLFLAVVALTASLVALNHPPAEARLVRRYLVQAGELVVHALPLMLVIFLLFPRISGTTLWGLGAPAPGASTGLSEEMSVGDVTSLADSSAPAFRVEFEGAPPPADHLYWRGPVLWHTDGRRWTGLTVQEIRSAPQAGYDAIGGALNYQVTVEPHGKRWLFALDLPAQRPPQSIMTTDFQLHAVRPVDTVRRYPMQSYLQYRTAAMSPELRRAALDLPPGRHPRTRALAERLLAQAGGDYRRFVEISFEHFRRDAFYYSRRPPALAEDPVDEFIFKTKRGFCEHYAAAFTVLMRAAGLPARVVTGYQGGEMNAVGNYLLVRQSDAHAWVEVYLEGSGWVRIDPTTAVPPERVDNRTDADRFRDTAPTLSSGQFAWLGRAWIAANQGWDAVNHGWNQWVLGYGEQRQQDMLRRLGLKEGWVTLALLLAAGSLLTVVALGLYMARHRRGREDPVQREYRRWLSRVARRGVVKHPGEGPLAFAERIANERPEWGPDALAIAERYAALRYGPERSEQDFGRLKQAVRAFRV